jgi:hypothetical protein
MTNESKTSDTESESENESESEAPRNSSSNRVVETKTKPKTVKVETEELPVKKKRTRTMTPELLEKLAVARKLAQEKRREMGKTSRTLKSQKDKQNELNKKRVLYQDERLRKLEEELNAIRIENSTDKYGNIKEVEEVKSKSKPKKKKVVIEVGDSDSDSESDSERKVIIKKKPKVIKKKKKVVVESESESDSESESEEAPSYNKLPHRGKPLHDPTFNESRSEKVNLGAEQQQHHKFEKELIREKPTMNMQLYRNLFPN